MKAIIRDLGKKKTDSAFKLESSYTKTTILRKENL